MIVNFGKCICSVSFALYENDRIYMSLVEFTTGDPMYIVTIDLPEQELNEDEVFIKDYCENAGVYDVLVDAGIISRYTRVVNLGAVNAYRCKLLRRE